MQISSERTRIHPHHLGAACCRECRRNVPDREAEGTRERLAALFPGISERHAYCRRCAREVEDVLLALAGGGA